MHSPLLFITIFFIRAQNSNSNDDPIPHTSSKLPQKTRKKIGKLCVHAVRKSISRDPRLENPSPNVSSNRFTPDTPRNTPRHLESVSKM